MQFLQGEQRPAALLAFAKNDEGSGFAVRQMRSDAKLAKDK
jgi:hypothetical protein